MKIIDVRNVEEALIQGLMYLYEFGAEDDSRAGKVLVAPEPVTTVYRKPMERVLFNPIRDANPFLHLFESLWLIAGRNDARWLDQFVSDFSARFAEDNGRLHGSYGFRWRSHFHRYAIREPFDQLDVVVDLLRANPKDRQAVLTMWDPAVDLGIPGLKDRPCNTSVFLRVRAEKDLTIPIKTVAPGHPNFGKPGWGSPSVRPVLDVTVLCRSNDVVWGAYGSNAVQFSVLQEYLAARIGVGVGTYTQVSNNYHGYCDILDKLEEKAILEHGINQLYDDHVEVTPLFTVPEEIDNDLIQFFACTMGLEQADINFANPAFHEVIMPLYWANHHWRRKDKQTAFRHLANMPPRSDWRRAAYQWFSRRGGVKVADYPTKS